MADNDVEQLRKIALDGTLSLQQTASNIFLTWQQHSGRCPFCEEDIPWHRGVVYNAGAFSSWVCMICAVLIVGYSRDKTPAQTGRNDPERRTPIPPGFVIAYIRTSWLPNPGETPLQTLEVARILGHDSVPRIWSAIIETDEIARLKPPEEDIKQWNPILLEQGDRHRTPKERLLSYFGSKEELSTSHFIHQANRWFEYDFPTLELDFDGLVHELPFVSDSLLHRIPSMTDEERRARVPRLGIVEKDAWNNSTGTNTPTHDLTSCAMTASIEGDYFAYLIPFKNYGQFYKRDPKFVLASDDDIQQADLGFDIGYGCKPEMTLHAPLWERVFGDQLASEFEVIQDPGSYSI